MLKPGIYKWESDEEGIFGGYIKLRVKETASSFILTLVENACKYNASQLEDLFRTSERLVIRKAGSKHAMAFSGASD